MWSPFRRRVCFGRRWNLRSFLFICLFSFALLMVLFVEPGEVSYTRAKQAFDQAVSEDYSGNTDIQPTINTPLHILIPATKRDINLCKLLLGLAVLEYPTPTLLAYNQTFTDEDAVASALHTVKILRVAKYLDSLGPEHDNDLVLLTDAYDIWVQLSPHVLISRYKRIQRQANESLRKRLGSAARYEDIKQTVFFGADKTCHPNEAHSVACYPIPQPPTREDLYGGNTDTSVGRTDFSSYRLRFLNSGYAIGPVKDMQKLFSDASALVGEYAFSASRRKSANATDTVPRLNTDQHIFGTLFGRQEYQRELLRRRYMSLAQRLRVKSHGDPLSSNTVQGVYVDDILQPSFTHETVDMTKGFKYEYRIGLDYNAELGHGTAEAEHDTEWLRFNENINSQIKGRSEYDCRSRVPETLPKDIANSTKPMTIIPSESFAELHEKNWEDVLLFTNLCYGTIPVMIHNNNGDGKALVGPWHKLWYQRGARENLRAQHQKAIIASGQTDFTLDDHKKRPSSVLLQGRSGGAWTDDNGFVEWKELCPTEWTKDLFGQKW